MSEREKAMSVACPWCRASAGDDCVASELEPVFFDGVHAGRIVRSMLEPAGLMSLGRAALDTPPGGG